MFKKPEDIPDSIMIQLEEKNGIDEKKGITFSGLYTMT